MFMPAWSPARGRRESPSRHLVHPLQKAGGSQRPAAQAGRRDLPHLGGRHRLYEMNYSGNNEQIKVETLVVAQMMGAMD